MQSNQAKITVDVNSKGEQLGDLFGIFFEDINHAADGGLYAQLLRNVSFEFSPIDHKEYHSMTAWKVVKGVATHCAHNVQCTRPLNHKNPNYLVFDVFEVGEEAGIQNKGYNTGVPYEKDAAYHFKCHAAATKGTELILEIALEDEANGKAASEIVKVVSDTWQELKVTLVPQFTSYEGRLTIRVKSVGRLYLDHVSLFPADTFKQRENGLRKDIAGLLRDLKPKFMRFPGGCLVHDGSLNADDRDSLYRWQNTIGPVEERPSRRSNWGYNQTLGLGYYEYFLFCEDIGAKPLPVLPAGYDPHHQRMVPYELLDEWIQEALDLIEFANGDETTKWGKVRAELGHREPFNLEYLAIGYEEVGDGFFSRYPYFHRAIKEAYPEIKLINSSGPHSAGSEYEKGWESARVYHSDLVDEHYYQTPEWFLANHHRYDTFSKEGPKVFLGEYASWGNTWYNALVEASFMVGLERNAPAVSLACYAPLLCNVDYVNWKPDMIWYNNHEVFGTPNYYVQKLFMNYQGDYQLDYTVEGLPKPVVKESSLSGKIALGVQSETTNEYFDIVVKDEDTGIIQIIKGNHIITGEDQAKDLCYIDAVNYTVTLKAKKLEGRKGFHLQFGKQDEDNKANWELGWWQNMDSILTWDQSGRNACLTECLFSAKIGQVYEMRLEVRDRQVKAFVDGILMNEVEYLPVVEEALYMTSSKMTSGETIIKLVNVSEVGVEAEITLENQWINGKQQIEAHVMSGFELEDMNSFETPQKVSPVVDTFEISNATFKYDIKPQSITILVVK